MQTIRELRLDQYRAFERFTLTLGDCSFLVGPNSAGKSTLIGAIRAAASMVALAKQKAPDRSVHDQGVAHLAWGLDAGRHGIEEASLPHEFRSVETRLRLTFSDRAKLTAVWPQADRPVGDADETDDPFFYLDLIDKPQPRRPADVRRSFPAIGQVPVLGPLERTEFLLQTGYVRQNVDSRLSTRHFRNQLRLLQDQDLWLGQEATYEDFLGFCGEWAPEVKIRDLISTLEPGSGERLDLFVTETGRRAEKEIAWAGDGIQVWLMLLLHIFRLRDSSTIVLDEPDVYLHPDLQRRLVLLLESLPAQTVVATHSSEMLGEANAQNVVWIDKMTRKGAKSKEGGRTLPISEALGSQFNLRFAKALRSKVVLFVEGGDMKMLSHLARRCGATKMAAERGLAVIPIGGYDSWRNLEAFRWLTEDLLSGSIETFVVLDRDYRSDVTVQKALRKLRSLDMHAHVWARKEIESYLLVPEAISRLSGAGPEEVAAILDSSLKDQEDETRSLFVSEWVRESEAKLSDKTKLSKGYDLFKQAWSVPGGPISMAPPKDVLSAINTELQACGFNTVSTRLIARELREDEVAAEMVDLLLKIERCL